MGHLPLQFVMRGYSNLLPFHYRSVFGTLYTWQFVCQVCWVDLVLWSRANLPDGRSLVWLSFSSQPVHSPQLPSAFYFDQGSDMQNKVLTINTRAK